MKPLNARPVRRVLRFAPLVMLSTAMPATAQRLGQGAGADISIWRVLLALLFCLALGAAAIFLLRRRYRGARPLAFGRERRLQLVENIRLSHQVDLCIVSRDGREYLIATSPQGVTVVDDGPFEVPASTPALAETPE
jgi:flagellar biogenesis protein FliO